MLVECVIDELLKLVRKKLTIKQLENALFLMKAEIDKADDEIIVIEINPDRTDMLSTEGIARALRTFLNVGSGIAEYPVKKSGLEVIVKPGLKKIREFIACGIVKDVRTSDDLIKEYMHLQEALTTTHGRNRKKASIGLYVLDEIEFPVIYRPAKPESIRFAPLGTETEMDGPTIINEHEKGILYGPIISKHKKWPLLIDSKGNTLSLPPIINSNTLGQVDMTTRNLFIEVTGTHKKTVDQALNIMVTSLAERGGNLESVTVNYPDGTSIKTPNLTPKKMRLEVKDVIGLTGLSLSDVETVGCLQKMGYDARIKGKGILEVKIPAYRTDVLHPVDLIEDVAIGYGFDRIEPSIPQTATSGKLLTITRLKNKIRDLLVGTGYQEIKSYVMSSPEIMNTKMLRNRPLTTTGNPKSREFSVLRNALLPVLLDFAAQNQHADYPQRIFEVGDVVMPDSREQTRTKQVPHVCRLIVDTCVNITEMLTEVGFILRNLGLASRIEFAAEKAPEFIDGRAGKILINGKTVGVFGEVSPEVLNNFGIGMPVVAFEMELPIDGTWAL
ncbi:MAG: phenylalanine--tRNA ligase subunit beta [Candidatus Thorarchaeota archaeon]|nr:phenylalanine--tRNA ligase subunit beta [Candidatus Thorarchaeota archaeon]